MDQGFTRIGIRRLQGGHIPDDAHARHRMGAPQNTRLCGGARARFQGIRVDAKSCYRSTERCSGQRLLIGQRFERCNRNMRALVVVFNRPGGGDGGHITSPETYVLAVLEIEAQQIHAFAGAAEPVKVDLAGVVAAGAFLVIRKGGSIKSGGWKSNILGDPGIGKFE